MKKILKFLLVYFPFKRQLYQLLRPLQLPEWLFRHLYFRGTFTISLGKTKFQMIHYGYQLENELYWQGLRNGWEGTSLLIWSELARYSEYVLDIGANTGYYSLVAKASNSKAIVHAFEPIERVYQRLKSNIELNEFDIVPYCQALSNYDGSAVVYDLPEEHIYSVTVNKNLSKRKDAFPVKIKVTTVDRHIKLAGFTGLDLIKLDVESHELEVLEGSLYSIEKFRPTLLVEILTPEAGEKIFQFLEVYNYLIFEIMEKEHCLSNVTGKISRFGNYLFCSQDKLSLINRVISLN